jgi:hypothetical protein
MSNRIEDLEVYNLSEAFGDSHLVFGCEMGILR